MQPEHKQAVDSGFSLLDRALEESGWEFVIEKRGVTVSSYAFSGDTVSTFKGDGLIAVVSLTHFLVVSKEYLLKLVLIWTIG